MAEPNESDLPPRRAQDFAEVADWPGYFAAVLGKAPRETLVDALDRFAREGVATGHAIDLAAGEGRDTLELLRRGWHVVATDSHPEAFALLLPRVPDAARPRLTTIQATFDETPLDACDLLNASFALPFCAPECFGELWRRIVAAIRPGGRFAGQFFGRRDSWATLPGRTHHDRAEIDALLAPFEIESIREEERDDPPTVRRPKHWHIFHVVARRRP